MAKKPIDELGTPVLISQGTHSLPRRDPRGSSVQASLTLDMNGSALASVRAYYKLLSDRGPVTAIPEFFHFPAVLIVGDQKTEFRTSDDIIRAYGSLLEKYRSEGICQVTFDETEASVFQVLPSLVLVKTIAIRMSSDNVVVRRWPCSYIVPRTRRPLEV